MVLNSPSRFNSRNGRRKVSCPLSRNYSILTLFDRAKWADQWFEDLERVVHTSIEKDRKDRQKPVRVAILDTGIDARHPQFKEALQLKKIKASLGFPDSLDALSDRNGHGTHGASVFLRTAPHAVLYIARIADDNGNIASENNWASVVEVLSHEFSE